MENNFLDYYCDYNFSLERELTQPGGVIYDILSPVDKARLRLLLELVDEEKGRISAESNLLMLFALTVVISDLYFFFVG